jgi:hypothetical protein
MDYATCLAVFEFEDASAAEAMLCQSLPNIKMEKVQAYFWMVESLDTQHSGHCEPYRDCEKTAYLTYAMKMTAKQMADCGISASDIADYLTSRGCSGTLTDKRMKYHMNLISQDMQDFTAIPRPDETEAAALIRVLQEKKCKFMYLYTNAPSTKNKSAIGPCEPSMLTIVTSNHATATLVQGQPVPTPTEHIASGQGFLGFLKAKLAGFFTDAWAGVGDPVLGERMVSDREKKSAWEPC